jgi:regulatory protein
MSDTLKKIYLSAMNSLARREHTETELLRKLQAKQFPDEEIHIALKKLVEEGALSHDRFIETYIRSRRNKGYGPLRIEGELKERGLKEDFIDPHLDMADNAWFTQARAVWQKRFKGQYPNDFKAKAQQARFLQYRGFTTEHIESIFNNNDDE